MSATVCGRGVELDGLKHWRLGVWVQFEHLVFATSYSYCMRRGVERAPRRRVMDCVDEPDDVDDQGGFLVKGCLGHAILV